MIRGEVLHEDVKISSSTNIGKSRDTLECPRCGYNWMPRNPKTTTKLWIKCPSCMRSFKNPRYVKPILEAINEMFEKLKDEYQIYFHELERARMIAVYIVKHGIDDNAFEQILSMIRDKKEYNS